MDIVILLVTIIVLIIPTYKLSKNQLKNHRDFTDSMSKKFIDNMHK